MSYNVRITMIIHATCKEDTDKLFSFLTEHAKDLCDASPEFNWVNSFACEEVPQIPYVGDDECQCPEAHVRDCPVVR